MFQRLTAAALLAVMLSPAQQQPSLDVLKQAAVEMTDARKKFTQEVVDTIFSFSELGYQELETSAYVTGILEKEGFRITRGVAGMPTAWVAEWGSGKPVIGLMADIDGLPETSQKPGVADSQRPGPRRRPQRRAGGERHGGACGQNDHGTQPHSGHHPALSRRGRRVAGFADLHGERGPVQRSRHHVVEPHLFRLHYGMGLSFRFRTRVDAILIPWRERARSRLALARTQRA